MANQEILDFTELTTPADDDVYAVVDISDTTEDPTGTTKKIQGQNVVAKKIKTTTGPTVLSVGAVADGEFLKRSGSSVIGASVDGSKVLAIACSDETTALTTGTSKVTFRMPYTMTLTAVRASLTVAQTSGSIFTVDINEAGTTILSTKITIDNTEKTSTTAATAPVISDSSLADDAEITVDIDQVGDGTAKGLKIYLIGT